jgi:predicted MFS family arabinose efflux permease
MLRNTLRRRSRNRSHNECLIKEDPTPSSEETPLLPSSSSISSDYAAIETPYLSGVSPARFWVLFLGSMMAFFVACFDSTIMASSHPVITSYFGSSNSASWLSTSFLLTSTAFQPLLGGLSDAVGRKIPYMATMSTFLVATVWCTLAQSMTSFILARAACGLGAGGMMALSSIIISDLVPIE